MADAEAVRREWARRVTDQYEGWPDWAAPDAAGSRTGSGWSWGVPEEDLADLDLRLAFRQHTGDTARALREERAYWGLDRPTDD